MTIDWNTVHRVAELLIALGCAIFLLLVVVVPVLIAVYEFIRRLLVGPRPDPALSRLEAAQIIERFLDGTCEPDEMDWFTRLGWDWDDPLIGEVARRCDAMPSLYPPPQGTHQYCGRDGLLELQRLAGLLREASELLGTASSTKKSPRSAP